LLRSTTGDKLLVTDPLLLAVMTATEAMLSPDQGSALHLVT
jgi:hypothetical protein